MTDDRGEAREEAAIARRAGRSARVFQRDIRAGGLRLELWVAIVKQTRKEAANDTPE